MAQALADGLLLARHLADSARGGVACDNALATYAREMRQRAGPRVAGSREAARCGAVAVCRHRPAVSSRGARPPGEQIERRAPLLRDVCDASDDRSMPLATPGI